MMSQKLTMYRITVGLAKFPSITMSTPIIVEHYSQSRWRLSLIQQETFIFISVQYVCKYMYLTELIMNELEVVLYIHERWAVVNHI